MRFPSVSSTPLIAVQVLLAGAVAFADPCGMVPPITVGGETPIARVGYQQTYVFYKDGLETFVIHPGFTGKVEEFGMLIPFPSVPALRKVPDATFDHLANAVDPPEVVVDLRIRRRFMARSGAVPLPAAAPVEKKLALKRDEVRVVKQEAVGMYEVAVLEAGSPKALNRWMTQHGYTYPKGMDAACEDYIREKWCFVAVKTKVAGKNELDPKPGQRSVNPDLPTGASFQGHVQAMGFRFKVDRLVVPMRLSTFNEGDLHNIVYVLSDEPLRIDDIPTEFVVRQIPGKKLFANVTALLPLRVIGGSAKDIPEWQRKNLPQRRNPEPKNGVAKELFASDLLSMIEDRLSHPHEEDEKMLLSIGERLGLRGTAIDRLNETSLKEKRAAIVAKSLEKLKGDFTLSVVDGNFPREVLQRQNLTFSPFEMASMKNVPTQYDAKLKGPGRQREGVLLYGPLSRFDGATTPADERKSITMPSIHAPSIPSGLRWLSVIGSLCGGAWLIRRRLRTAVDAQASA